jgi:protein-arginine kinase activator protein McsA
MEGLRSAAPARTGAAELEARLAKAILEENYEEAARLRDLLASRTPPA